MRIGSPIKGYGQESRNRAARQRIPHRVWNDEDGVEHIEVIVCKNYITAFFYCVISILGSQVYFTSFPYLGVKWGGGWGIILPKIPCEAVKSLYVCMSCCTQKRDW